MFKNGTVLYTVYLSQIILTTSKSLNLWLVDEENETDVGLGEAIGRQMLTEGGTSYRNS